MKCLTVKQPWAFAIFLGKTVENRSWPTRYRGPLLIHAGTRPDGGGLRRIHEIAGDWIVPDNLNHPDYSWSAIIGRVDLVACQRDTGLQWGEPGMYHWVLSDSWLFDKPIPWTGRQGLFNVPDSFMEAQYAQC